VVEKEKETAGPKAGANDDERAQGEGGAKRGAEAGRVVGETDAVRTMGHSSDWCFGTPNAADYPTGRVIS